MSAATVPPAIKYKIQFQKALSLREFNEAYGSERKCLLALLNARWPDGYVCRECGCKEFYEVPSRGVFQCRQCRLQTSPKAGTIFQDSKLPLSVWFQAMHLLTQGKHSLSALELKRQLGVCYETAWSIKQKLMHVMQVREERTMIGGRIEVDDAYMGGAAHEGKRGRGSAGKTPFVVAVETDPENPGSVARIKMKALRAVSMEELRPFFEQFVVKKSLVVTDKWRSYNFLEGMGYYHEAWDAPGGWRSSKMPSFRWVNTVLGNLKGNVKGVTRWVSRVHLDRYLAEFQYRFNRRFDLKSILPRLLFAAVRTLAMPQPILKISWMGQSSC
jgi:transposase-like protein/ribosomal protein L37AE/L43A